MRVAELIDELRKFNPDSEVLVAVEDGDGASPAVPIWAVGRVVTAQGGGPYVQIEGAL